MATTPSPVIVVPLGEFQNGRYTATFQTTADELHLHDGHELARFDDPIRVAVEARRLAEGEILVKCAVAFAAHQECVACLEPVDMRADETLEMIFYPETQRPEMEESGDALDTLDIGFHDGVQIELDDEVAGFILQLVPEYPRCADDCAGLDLTGARLPAGAAPHDVTARRSETFEPEWKRQLRELSRRGADATTRAADDEGREAGPSARS